jgi:hypothetical protein
VEDAEPPFTDIPRRTYTADGQDFALVSEAHPPEIQCRACGAKFWGLITSSDEEICNPDPAATGPTPLSWMHDFVHHQNLFLYVDQLEREHRPERRRHLATLLTEEEDRHGALLERLERTELLLYRSKSRAARQRALIDERAANGRDTIMDKQTLANMDRVLEIFEQYRDLVRDAVDRSSP